MTISTACNHSENVSYGPEIQWQEAVEQKINIPEQFPDRIVEQCDLLGRLNILNDEFRDILDRYLVAKSKCSLNSVNRHSRDYAKQKQVQLINSGEISLADLGIKSYGSQRIKDLVSYFGMENCLKIIRLDLSECDQINEKLIDKATKYFPNIQHLSLKKSLLSDYSTCNLCKFNLLKSLDVASCEVISNADFLKSFLFLEEINFNSCISLRDISVFKDCKQLKRIDLGNCLQLTDFTPLGQCINLEYLNVELCSWLYVSPALLLCSDTLKNLNLARCPATSNLDDLKKCKFAVNLTTLNLERCTTSSLSFLKHYPYLIRLNLKGATKLSNIDDLKYCRFLEDVDISQIGCSNEESGVRNISALGECLFLKRLDMGFSKHITTIECLASCTELEYFNMGYCFSVEGIGALKHCTKLKEVYFKWCAQLEDISDLAPCKQLIIIDLYSCGRLKSIDVVRNFLLLEELDISECTALENAEAIGFCLRLRGLSMKGCNNLKQPSFWSSCRRIEFLDLSQCLFDSISFLEHLPDLKQLIFTSCLHITDFEPIQKCKKLNLLRLDNSSISQIGFLKFLPDLNFLYLINCNSIEDFSVLPACAKLKVVDLFQCVNAPVEIIDKLNLKNVLVVSSPV